jgi:hypothetical protein
VLFFLLSLFLLLFVSLGAFCVSVVPYAALISAICGRFLCARLLSFRDVRQPMTIDQ